MTQESAAVSVTILGAFSVCFAYQSFIKLIDLHAC